MNESLLQLKDVSFAYEDSDFALKQVSLEICRGEKIAVLGNNGAGKSTFFLLCNGVLRPDSGTLLYRGQPITGKKKDLLTLREKVGLVFQDPNHQLIGATVESEVSFGPMNLKLSRAEVTTRIQEAMEEMALLHLRQRPPQYLSGGQKKRVSIADVLAMHPDMILFDEPTASLDPAGIHMLERTLSQMEKQKQTLVISTHDIDFAWRWAERILVFHEGRITADGDPQEIFSQDALLEEAGLCRPYLMETALILKKRGWLAASSWPKTVTELEMVLQG